VVQSHPSSILQLREHPAPPLVLPTSHSSSPSTTPLPHSASHLTTCHRNSGFEQSMHTIRFHSS